MAVVLTVALYLTTPSIKSAASSSCAPCDASKDAVDVPKVPSPGVKNRAPIRISFSPPVP